MHRPQSFFSTLIFLIILSAILGIIHYFIYFSVTRFIDLEGRENFYLATSLGFFPGVLSGQVYVRTIGIIEKLDMPITFLPYGWEFFSILLFLFLTVWGVAFLFDIIGLYFPLIPLGIIALFVAILTAIYGLSNARNIQITRVEIAIQNLPDFWEGKRIAHISDVHVGHILRSPFVRKIVKKVNQEDPAMLCITGDLFDGMDGKLEHLVHPLSQITAPYGVIYVDGNHETYLGIERAFASLHETKTRILRDEILTIEGLDIIGIDYPAPGIKKDIAKTIQNLEAFNKENPSILLYHTPYQVDAIARTGVDLELCGHTHRGQLWPGRYLSSWVFRGRDYGLTHIGNFSLYTSSGVGTWGPPMRVGTRSEIVIITLHRA